jgi:hypothetical protein
MERNARTGGMPAKTQQLNSAPRVRQELLTPTAHTAYSEQPILRRRRSVEGPPRSKGPDCQYASRGEARKPHPAVTPSGQ